MEEIAIGLLLRMLWQLGQWVDGIIELLVLSIGCGAQQAGLAGISSDLLTKDIGREQTLEFVQCGLTHPPGCTGDGNGLGMKLRHQQVECK